MKKGISLIVLIITIIVMIILAGVIILSLTSSGIISKAEDAVDKTNLSEVQHLATLLWSDEYLKQQEENKIDQVALENAVITGLSKEKINLADYIITVTTTGVNVEKAGDWVVATVDEVPIPRGFVASPYGADASKGIKAENTKAGGLVIYELKEGETAIDTSKETQYESWTTRNQYVWVPVDKDEFDTQFVRKNFTSTPAAIIENVETLGEDLRWEVIPTTQKTEQNLKFMTEEMLDEVQKMYASVKEYGGFYIARYEAGIDTHRTELGNAEDLPGIKEGTNVYSVMGKIPYTYISWSGDYSFTSDKGGAIEVARGFYPDNTTKNKTGVVSTLTYGVQWDRTVQWIIDTGAMTIAEVSSSQDYGNHSGHVINAKEDLNDGAQVWDYSTNSSGTYVSKDSDTLTFPKASGKSWALSTGALKEANINNIYDMSGNMYEWTVEGANSVAIGEGTKHSRVARGKWFNNNSGGLALREGRPLRCELLRRI